MYRPILLIQLMKLGFIDSWNGCQRVKVEYDGWTIRHHLSFYFSLSEFYLIINPILVECMRSLDGLLRQTHLGFLTVNIP